MSEKIDTKTYNSAEELKNASKFNFEYEELDPHREDAIHFVSLNEEHIVKKVRDNEKLWNEAYSTLGHDMQLASDVFEIGPYHFIISIIDYDGEPKVRVMIFHKEWSEKRIKETEELFDESELSPGDREMGLFPIDHIAKKIGIDEKPNFSITDKDFDPTKIVDALDEGIDDNIMELIKLLNMIGLTTAMSCGGHKDRENYPYIRFKSDGQLKNIISLFVEWKREGGLTSYIRPIGLYGYSVEVSCSRNTPLSEAQKDFDRFTDFLSSHIIGFDTSQLSPAELKHRQRRKLGHVFEEEAS